MTTTQPATDFETIELQRDENVARIMLNRPDRYNAINLQMHAELTKALATVSRDRDVRCLVIGGNGRGFCSGQDLAEFGVAKADPTFRVDDHVRSTFNKTVQTIRDLPIPVIASVNGVAAGAGFSLALCADLRIASTNASGATMDLFATFISRSSSAE